MKSTSQRQKRVSELVRQLIAESFYDKDFSVVGITEKVTISAVTVSKDLKLAHVFYTLLNDGKSAADIKKLTKQLNEQAYTFNTYLARSMQTKYTPKVRFFYDETLEESSRVDRILSNISLKDVDGTA